LGGGSTRATSPLSYLEETARYSGNREMKEKVLSKNQPRLRLGSGGGSGKHPQKTKRSRKYQVHQPHKKRDQEKCANRREERRIQKPSNRGLSKKKGKAACAGHLKPQKSLSHAIQVEQEQGLNLVNLVRQKRTSKERLRENRQ